MSWGRTVSMAARLTGNRPLDGSVKASSSTSSAKKQEERIRPEPPVIDISHIDHNSRRGNNLHQQNATHCSGCMCGQVRPQVPPTSPPLLPPAINFYDQNGGRQDPWAPQQNTGARPRIQRYNQPRGYNQSQRINTRPALPAPENTTGIRKKVCCLYCGKVGHTHRECTLRPKCFYCQRRGHLKKDCYQFQNKCILCNADGHTIEE